jgi:hypothetical protein
MRRHPRLRGKCRQLGAWKRCPVGKCCLNLFSSRRPWSLRDRANKPSSSWREKMSTEKEVALAFKAPYDVCPELMASEIAFCKATVASWKTEVLAIFLGMGTSGPSNEQGWNSLARAHSASNKLKATEAVRVLGRRMMGLGNDEMRCPLLPFNWDFVLIYLHCERGEAQTSLQEAKGDKL